MNNTIKKLDQYKRINKSLWIEITNWIDCLLGDGEKWGELQSTYFVIEDLLSSENYNDRDEKHFKIIMNLIFDLTKKEFLKYIGEE